MAAKLKSLTIKGYKSWRSLENFEPGQLTVLIGGNGSGKSNLLSFFEFLRESLREPDAFNAYISKQGGASWILHDGPKITNRIEWEVVRSKAMNEEVSHRMLERTTQDGLFARGFSEKILNIRHSLPTASETEVHPDAAVDDIKRDSSESLEDTTKRWKLFRFSDTSPESPIRRKSTLSDDIELRSDAGNLPSILYRMGRGLEKERARLRRIEKTLGLIIPFFDEFVLQPEYDFIMLRWREKGSEQVFSASQASDGTLRAMALISLLLQPDEKLPSLILLDEPELGLHPSAITLIAQLMKAATDRCQIIAATQSVPFIDEFGLDHVAVVGRAGRESTLTRLSEHSYASWLEEYSPGDLWRMNIIGGGPHG